MNLIAQQELHDKNGQIKIAQDMLQQLAEKIQLVEVLDKEKKTFTSSKKKKQYHSHKNQHYS